MRRRSRRFGTRLPWRAPNQWDRTAPLIVAPAQGDDARRSVSRATSFRALKYFQQLTDAKAAKVLRQSRVVRVDDGFEVKFEGQLFWIPDAPKLPWESSHGVAS